MTAFVRISEDLEPLPAPGEWRVTWHERHVRALIGCPCCGRHLETSRVDAQGTPEHAVFCDGPDGCKWWGYVELDGWRDVRARYGAAAEKPVNGGLNNGAARHEVPHMRQDDRAPDRRARA